MNTKKFKAMLFSCVIGVAGCNKIGNPSYMDGGGDKKDKKKQEAEASFSVEQSSSNVIVLESSTIDHNKMLEDSLSGIKRVADTAEQVAISKQQAAERAIKDAANARISAEMARKTANNREKSRQELGGSDASTSTGMASKTEDDREREEESRLKLGEGGGVL